MSMRSLAGLCRASGAGVLTAVVCCAAVSAALRWLTVPAVALSSADVSELFSHAVFDSLLQCHVAGGKVFYDGFNAPSFRLYCSRLAAARPAQWSRDEQMAFWLNAYNAAAVSAVLSRPGLRMLSNADGFFDRDSFAVAGEYYTLSRIVNEHLRTFGDPAVLFGASCGAAGLPRLHNRAFRAASVRKTLRDNARKYVRGDAGAVLDVAANVVVLPALFELYRADFERSGPLLQAVLPYVRETEAAYIAVYRKQLVVRFLPCDWRLAGRVAETGKETAKPYDKPRKTAAKKR